MAEHSGAEVEAKFLSGLLTGVNRAYPFVKQSDLLDQHVDTLFKVAHLGGFSCAVQSLMLLFQMLGSRQAVAARFYRYERRMWVFFPPLFVGLLGPVGLFFPYTAVPPGFCT